MLAQGGAWGWIDSVVRDTLFSALLWPQTTHHAHCEPHGSRRALHEDTLCPAGVEVLPVSDACLTLVFAAGRTCYLRRALLMRILGRAPTMQHRPAHN